MKILLVSPSKDPVTSRKVHAFVRFPQISLLYVAALIPADHEVTLVEEETESIDFNADCDLVGITCMTATASRAYELAEEFRRRGKTVVLGGVHPSVLPEEAKRHCDAVVVGEAEPVWNRLLADREAGRLQPFYRASTDWDLDEGPLPRREPCHSPSVLGVAPVVASRGCPYSCEFCCVKSIFGRKIRLDLAADTGCVGLFIGLESVSEEKMRRMNKSMRSLEETEHAVSRITESGIFLHASIVFGFDDDEPSVFDDTLEFLERTRIPSVTFNILTPYPGTDLHAQLRSENRILTEDWRYYDHCTPVFVPRRMSPAELYEA